MVKNVNALVSIVVPVYNVENYIDKCVESIINQTYTDIEIILVDDASLDGSAKKCDDWATRDSRITVEHKKANEGLNMARKTGFDLSHGQYITFLDSDDLFHKDNVKDSLSILTDSKADIVVYATMEFNNKTEDKLPHINNEKNQVKIITDKIHKAQYAFFGDRNLSGVQYMTVWGKLYDRKIIQEVDWAAANYRSYEDSFWTPQALLGSKKIVIVSKSLIYYRRNTAYGANGDNLGNRLTENSINGRVIGYLELIEIMQDFYLRLSRNYGFGDDFDGRIKEQSFISKVWRIDNLARAGQLRSENNEKYILQILTDYINSKNEHIDNLDATIAYLDQNLIEVRQYLAERDAEVTHLSQKIEELSGIRRTAKLLLGNVKRRALKSRR